ncbi:hypothetical protein MMC28_005005 [Mycoblastus sanguinarius]|nr:hypothetical protein [Mycoblastus sanguinarius]
MAEAFAVIGLVSAIVALTETRTKIVSRLNEAKESGTVFADVADQLPLILEIFGTLQANIAGNSVDQDTALALSRAIEGCLRQVKRLGVLIEKSSIAAGDNKLQRLRKAISGAHNEQKVQEIQSILETYKTTLVLHLGRHAAVGAKSLGHAQLENICKLPKSQVSHFVGRGELLVKIDEIFSPGTNERRIIVLHGMGGQGKTQIALEYCRRAKISGKFPTIIWLDATSPGTITKEFGQLADNLAANKRSFPNLESKTQYVKERLEHWPSPFLLVFDICDRPSALQGVRDNLPGGFKGAVLCTSRHAESDRLGFTIEIPAMSETEALELLLLRCKLKKTPENLEEGRRILEQITCLPLAVDQAGSYIKSRRLPLPYFLEDYQARKAAMLKHTPQLWEYRKKLGSDETESSLSVFTTWELAIAQIREDQENIGFAGQLLSFAAFFDCFNVPEDLFRLSATSSPETLIWATGLINDDRQWDSYSFQDMMAGLMANSLIDSLDFENQALTISLHPLIREWARLRLSDQGRKQNTIAAISALGSFLEDDAGQHLRTYLPKCNTISHLDASVENSHLYLNDDLRLGQGSLTRAGILYA